ncbi:DctP family TRAP transporter solute-binding subunit [uncultured Fretibacterium sp.]|uniref:DctP family TRAP transporter solute-binding subunit n=1 Tax=uncultured Fretibacterium sp. TaxID=1678694 RepID=UPI0026100A08|nr:DctP family TRAP transporter solute-binding subunit [uncultured Fretibacterium sp.]
MKKMLIAVLGIVFVVVFCSICLAKTIELRMNLTTSESSVWMVGAREFKRLVEEGTEGRYKISIFPNEQLSGGDMVKGVEMLFTGVTDVDFHSVINMTGFEPKLTVVTMPWLFPEGYKSVDNILFNGEGGVKLKELIEKKGAHVLAFGENGFRQITNNVHPITGLADMKQLKIRTPAIAMYVDLFKLFGADPTAMNFAEVFTALQQRTIDGQENPLDTIRSAKIHEVQKYISLWNYSYDPIALSVSGRVWKKLSDADKEIFNKAGVAAMKKQVEASRALDSEILKSFESTMTVTRLTPEQVQEFKAAAAPIYEQYREKIGEELFKAFGYSF